MQDVQEHNYIEPHPDGSWRCSCGALGGGREVSENENVTYASPYAAWMLHRVKYV